MSRTRKSNTAPKGTSTDQQQRNGSPAKTLSTTTRPRAVDRVILSYLLRQGARCGDAVNEARIAGTARLTRTPIREGLFRLAGLSGIVEQLPGGGFAIRHFDVQDVQEMVMLRFMMEPRAAGNLAHAVRLTKEANPTRRRGSRADPGDQSALPGARELRIDAKIKVLERTEQVEYLRHVCAQIREARRLGNLADVLVFDMHLHCAIMDFSSRRVMAEFLAILLTRLAVAGYRLTDHSDAVARMIDDEHEQITSAISAGSPSAAFAAMKLHLRNTLERDMRAIYRRKKLLDG